LLGLGEFVNFGHLGNYFNKNFDKNFEIIIFWNFENDSKRISIKQYYILILYFVVVVVVVVVVVSLKIRERRKMSEVATLRVQKEQLRERLRKAEAALRATEQREFELRNDAEKRINKAVELKMKSHELKSNAIDSTKKRAIKEAQQLKAELSETHATFKQKLQIERDLRFRAVDELESLRATIQTMKKHNQLYAKRTHALEAENERAIHQADSKAQKNIQELKDQLDSCKEEISEHLENLKVEREARFEAETKRRQAERIAKRAKTSASTVNEELKSMKQKLDSVQARLDRASRGQRSALQIAKEAKEKSLMTLESTKKDLAMKDIEIKRLNESRKRSMDSASTLQSELERRIRELEKRIDADRQAFQTERSQWSSLEIERDQAREQLVHQIDIGEKCKNEVENMEESLRIVQDQLGQEKLKRLDVERRIAQKNLKETELERSRVEMSMQLRARNQEMREIKSALETRGISLEFLIGKEISTIATPVVVRKSLARISAEALSPSSDFAAPSQQQSMTTSNVGRLSPSESMENILSAPNSCDSPRNPSSESKNKKSVQQSLESSDSDRSSLGGSISVDASISNWKRKVEGAASGALWGVRRKEISIKKTPFPSKKEAPKKSHNNRRPLNPAAVAALRRAERNNSTPIVKEL
jgi:myosin heavy subunit